MDNNEKLSGINKKMDELKEKVKDSLKMNFFPVTYYVSVHD